MHPARNPPLEALRNPRGLKGSLRCFPAPPSTSCRHPFPSYTSASCLSRRPTPPTHPASRARGSTQLNQPICPK
ncbi:hypothetical protein E2C01_064061 [Portunus trituberculatus]|uniref:Uncharacterized protein n=1 Tax=Portunus trituberculatus TaxID=210409 RepID=A0A5B7HC40_PORTR|nr:hypothetical protein [Portunus trituberculatus]